MAGLLAHVLAPGLVLALAPPGTIEPSGTCALLTAGDIEIATGAKPGTAQPGGYSAPAGGGRSVNVELCTWTIPAHRGQLVVSVAPLAAGTSAASAARHNPGTEALREKGWTERAADFPNCWCSIFTPPASEKDGIRLSTCTAGVKGQMVTVAFTSPSRKLSIDQVKALTDRATGRLR